MDDLRDAARPAAEWWGERVRTVRAESDGLHENLTSEQAYQATAEIGMRAAQIQRAAVDEQTVEAFVVELARLITEAGGEKVTLRVDYHPDPLLAQAAQAAGLPDDLFPRKSSMHVRPSHVLGKAGYSAAWALVWSAEGWVRPPCGVQEWPDDSEDPVGPECARPRWHEGPHDWETARRS